MGNHEEVGRQASLDLSRFLAAIIVLLGHLLWFNQRYENLQKNSLLEILRTGDQSVLYFFTLSGFVLAMTTSKVDSRWLKARFVRLMPVYFICFISPLILVRVMAPEEFYSYPTIGIWLGIAGIQSLFANYYLVGANSPLWSLSVEFILSLSLVMISRFKSVKTNVLCILACEVINTILFQPVINGLTFFLIGIVFYQIRAKRSLSCSDSRIWIGLSGSFVICYWILFPIIDISLSAPRFVDVIGVTFTLIYFDQLKFHGRIQNISGFLGKRTYSLFAVHSPILRFHSEMYEKISITNSILNNNLFYLGTAILLIVCSTEALFQLVEKPSIKYAKQIRKPLEN